ncbi:MAG: hypothetical protein IJZ19_07480 [Lentisphaeria bacterium]|nr:hypothetical protein [Lentisphaeria bacterium]
MLRPLNAPIKYAALFYRGIAPGERYCRVAAMLTLRLYFRRHFKAATNVPPLDHVRVRPGAKYALRAEFYLKHRRLESPARGDSRPLPRPTFGRFARIFFSLLFLLCQILPDTGGK